MEESLFAFLERDLGAPFTPPTSWLAPLPHATELANDDWSEADAAHAVATRAERKEVLAAYVTVMIGLAQTPWLDTRGIRSARILRKALDELRPPVQVAPVAEPSPRRRRWLRTP